MWRGAKMLMLRQVDVGAVGARSPSLGQDDGKYRDWLRPIGSGPGLGSWPQPQGVETLTGLASFH